jgi:hypothetical protein
MYQGTGQPWMAHEGGTVMDVVLDTQPSVEDMTYLWASWVDAAQQQYGFDGPTAQRLGFIRGLVRTARLGDWTAAVRGPVLD